MAEHRKSLGRRLNLSALKASLKEVWSYGTGKIGLIMLVILVSVAISAIIVLPPNFPDEWNNPKYWSENPTLVPPDWVKYLGVPVAEQYVNIIPGDNYALNFNTTQYYSIPIFSYIADYRLSVKVFPQGILIKINGLKLLDRYIAYNITQGQRYVAPMIIVTVKRPDGIVLVLYKGTPSITYIGNTTTTTSGIPYIYEKSPFVILPTNIINYQAVQEEFMKLYGVNTTIVSGLGANTLKLSQVVFGKPVLQGGNVTYVPLTGTYELRVSIVLLPDYPVKLAIPPTHSIKVIVKGTAFGLMGTDSQGRDLALGLYYGFPVALSIGLIVAFIDTVIGVIAGAVSGYYGGLVDEFIQRLVDIMGNIPLLPILIIIGEIARQIYMNNPFMVVWIILLTIIIFTWGGLAIVIRSMTLSIKGEQYVEAAKCLGASNKRIIFLHIIPQVIPYAVASMVFSVPSAILTVAGLAVLGIIKNFPSWGTILAAARSSNAPITAWWWIIPPGLLIAITSLTFVLIGMALERIVEPRLRTR
ncbi:MAG: ABC transporter permease [Crenarchaeota archaeon]|nr:ABC transporter permease [Thermoproteota archaeon]